jgi:hypothetical protein
MPLQTADAFTEDEGTCSGPEQRGTGSIYGRTGYTEQGAKTVI